MAMKISAGDYGRGDLYFFDPKEIVVHETLNGRWDAHDENDVAKLVKSFEEPDTNGQPTGQLQPVQVRRLADKRVQLVLGFRRWKASLKYNELHQDTPMKLKAIVVEINDEEALRRNIIENRERKATTPMDDAITQNRLREQHGWNDTRIASFYDVTPPYVGQLRKLLTLTTDVQKLIHRKELAVDAALGLADLPAEIQAAILPAGQPTPIADATVAAVTDGSAPIINEPAQVIPDLKPGETLSQGVKRKVRDAKVAAGGKQARNLRDLRVFFEELTGPAEKPTVKTLAELFLKFIQGYYTDATMAKKVAGLFPAGEVTPAPSDAVALPSDAQEGQPEAEVAKEAEVAVALEAAA